MVTNRQPTGQKTIFSGEQWDTKGRIVFEQEVGSTDFTFCLVKTWIQSPFKLALYGFLKEDKGKVSCGLNALSACPQFFHIYFQ